MEILMDYFFFVGDSFDVCLTHLAKVLKEYKDTSLVLNWKKCQFMVKEEL